MSVKEAMGAILFSLGLAVLFVIGSCRQASAQDKLFTVSEWTVMLGHGLDAVSSQRAFAEHRGVEANHWLAQFDDPLAFTTAKFAVGGLQLYLLRKLKAAGHPRWATVTNFGIGSGFIALGFRNERVGK